MLLLLVKINQKDIRLNRSQIWINLQVFLFNVNTVSWNIVIDCKGRSDLRYNGCKINTQSEIKDKIFHSSDIEEP